MATRGHNMASAQAQLIISDAFDRFKETVASDDMELLSKTTVDNVIDAIVIIQQDLRNRRENRNLRKLYPLLEGLKKYGQAVDVLSNGLSPYLPWAWAPIKLALQITSDYLDAFDKLVEAYARISETLPRLERIRGAFKDDASVLTKLALYYADILEFHRRSYKFIRRRSWKFFFKTTWAQFDVRFDAILASMARHSDMITQEATTIDIIEAKAWREKLLAESEQKEKDRSEQQRLSLISWLGAKPKSQQDECEYLLQDYHPGTCDWVQDKFQSWLGLGAQQPSVWLHGKPGAGKSVLCASLLDTMGERNMPTLFYFCKHQANDTASEILKTMILQLVTQNSDLMAIAYTEYVSKYASPSLKVLRAMMVGSSDRPGMIRSIPSCRIVVDGLDECHDREQNLVIDELTQLISVGKSTHNCKVLLSSRNIPSVSRYLQKKGRKFVEISLSVEHVSVNSAIRAFVHARLDALEEGHPALQLGSHMKEELSQIVIDKADGMFLWARLVLDSISDIDSTAELHEAITKMPRELPKLYDAITYRLCHKVGPGLTKISKIFTWLLFSKRPLRMNEVLHGVAITPETPRLNQWNKIHNTAIDKCRPLVEELPDGTVSLVHSTVQEYLTQERVNDELKPLEWMCSIAFTCVSVLGHGLSLLDPDVPLPEKLHAVAEGSHALLPYAIDFWVEHLLDCSDRFELASSPGLFEALSNFELEHGKILVKLGVSMNKETASQEGTGRLQAIAHLPAISLCASVLEFQQRKTQLAEDGAEFEKFVLNHDSTLLSRLSVKFYELINRLVSGAGLPDTLTQEQLELFRNQYSSCLFRCRFSPCVNTSLGFTSESARVAHEQLHLKRLFCDKPGCDTSRFGFKRQKDLTSHNRIYHEEGGVLIPARIRKPPLAISGLEKRIGDIISGPAEQSMENTRSRESHPTGLDPIIETQTLLTFDDHIEVSCICLSNDGVQLAVAYQDSIYIYTVSTSKIICILSHGFSTDQFTDIAFSPDGHYLATASDPAVVAVNPYPYIIC
ncbi:hypothetical protein F5Y04DRAFT_209138 [Hypomontagnella monticulosa]|nr:hypothetical protein F5Y04DRAFT_209138 [Hypomontagnella monticulosa]